MSSTLMANSRMWAGMSLFASSRPVTKPQRAIRVSGLNKSEAEDLLDWLEANGYRDYKISYAPGQGFTVVGSNDRKAEQSVVTQCQR
jgi:hypothetical protein